MNLTDLFHQINRHGVGALMRSVEQKGVGALMRSAEQTKTIVEISAVGRLQDVYAPGTFLGDILIVKTKSGTQKDQALLRLGSKILFYPKKPAARRALGWLAREFKTTPKKLLSKWLIPAGLMFALDNRKIRKTFRPGKTWIKGRDNKIAKIPPESLGATEFDRWIVRESRRNAVESVLEYYHIEEQSFDEIDQFGAYGQKNDESQAIMAQQIVLLLEKQATPQQRELMKFASLGLKDPEIAKKMKVKPSTVRVTKHHVKLKAVPIRRKILNES